MGGAETVPAEAQKFHEIMTSWKCSNTSDIIEKYLAQTIHEENYLKSVAESVCVVESGHGV